MPEDSVQIRNGHNRGTTHNDSGRRPFSKNKHWVADQSATKSGTSTSTHIDGERWERGGFRGARGRGNPRTGARKFPNASLVRTHPSTDGEEEEQEEDGSEVENHEIVDVDEEPVLETEQDREAFYKELVKAREIERKKAIAEGKMDDPLVPKRLADAISMVGTCMDMCPRFERYRREREGTLYQWEMKIPGTKRVDHKLAVKQYERAVGDKTLPSDLRPPKILKKTLNYLFCDLLPRGGFGPTFNFIRDRSRAVRNDFTVQHESGPLAIECHDRCARFHILALHFQRENPQVSMQMEEQQLMYTLQSLKEFYEDQRGRYNSPTELEMRVYHRFIHIRDQQERREDIPSAITEHPVFKLTTKFRLHVQAKSAPIGKTTPLIVDADGMQIFGELAAVLREQGSLVMIYLVACILEKLFGKDTIEDIEAIRGDLSIPDIIDGVSDLEDPVPVNGATAAVNGVPDVLDSAMEEEPAALTSPLKASATEWLATNFGPEPTSSAFGQTPNASAPAFDSKATPTSAPLSQPPTKSAFANLSSVPNAFGSTSVFGGTTFGSSTSSKSVFGGSNEPAKPQFSAPPSSVGPNLGSVTNAFASTSSLGSSSPFVTFTATSDAIPQENVLPPVSTKQDAEPASSSGVQTAPTGMRPISTPSANRSSTSSVAPLNLSFNPNAPAFVPIPKPSNMSAPPFAAPSGSSGSTFPPALPTAPVSAAKQNVPPSNSIPNFFSTSTTTEDKLAAPTPANGTHIPLFGSSKPSFPSSYPAPPPRPTINTDPSIIAADLLRTPPTQPPPLNKQQPISLPSTPTLSSFPTSSKPSRPLLAFPKGVLAGSLSTPVEALSPLHLHSPMIPKPLGAFNSNSTPTPSVPAAIIKPKSPTERKLVVADSHRIFASGKGKEPAVDLDTQAISFSRRGLLVKECFDRWQKRTTDRAAWIEACRRSDAYSEKIQHQRLSTGTSTPDKKRRLTTAISPEIPHKKRARRRVSSEYKPPRTDEELARRFQENHEEHERRWAQGSFLRVVKAHVKSKARSIPQRWSVWLSMNPENDGTAIWFERKFDVPTAGEWESESIFSIPLSQRQNISPFPGVIIFECTPLDGIVDELERKYRILDDCSRLREIVQSLPPTRHYVPSLLAVSWAEGDPANTPSDFLEMIAKLQQDEVLGSFYLLSITSTTKDLDQKFEEALISMTLDVEGRLVQPLTLQDGFSQFEEPWKDFVDEWVNNCSSPIRFDWILHSRVIEASISLLNALTRCLVRVLGLSPVSNLPSLSMRKAVDSASTYDTVSSWLDKEAAGDSAAFDIRADISSHRTMGRDFPTLSFFEHIRDLVLHRVQHVAGKDSLSTFYVLKADLKLALDEFESMVQSSVDGLEKLHISLARRSPKRRNISEDDESSSSPLATKRMKMSQSNVSSVQSSPNSSSVLSPEANGPISPSPSTTTSIAPDERSSLITAAMLRALTQDLKRKYVSG